MTRRTKAAFTWIVGLLRKNKIPFQIFGGFAANIYGSNRALVDIDIEIPESRFSDIIPEIKRYIIEGPERYKDENFDVFYLSLIYKGQEIDICGIETQRLFNQKTGKWFKRNIDLTRANRKKVFSLFVPVIPRKDLISYKKKLGRDMDVQDVQALSG